MVLHRSSRGNQNAFCRARQSTMLRAFKSDFLKHKGRYRIHLSEFTEYITFPNEADCSKICHQPPTEGLQRNLNDVSSVMSRNPAAALQPGLRERIANALDHHNLRPVHHSIEGVYQGSSVPPEVWMRGEQRGF